MSSDNGESVKRPPVPPKAHRQNVIANAVRVAWGENYWLPLTIRYEAARAADAVVEAWVTGDDPSANGGSGA